MNIYILSNNNDQSTTKVFVKQLQVLELLNLQKWKKLMT